MPTRKSPAHSPLREHPQGRAPQPDTPDSTTVAVPSVPTHLAATTAEPCRRSRGTCRRHAFAGDDQVRFDDETDTSGCSRCNPTCVRGRAVEPTVRREMLAPRGPAGPRSVVDGFSEGGGGGSGEGRVGVFVAASVTAELAAVRRRIMESE